MATNSPSISKIATSALGDLNAYLAVIEQAIYTEPLEILSGSTIGQHTRHIIEFYICLLDQVKEGNVPVINYAARSRDYHIESMPSYALDLVLDISDRLEALDESQNCLLDCSEHGHESLIVKSTIARELIYNIEHTIHHLAIIKIALRFILPSLVLPQDFGVAPSTLRHRQDACAQ